MVPFTLNHERSAQMFTRVVELTSKSGKSKELSDTINERVVPILKKQRGFVDETVLVSDTEPTRVLGLSFWNNKEDAERYHQEQYPKIHDTAGIGGFRLLVLKRMINGR
jgi:heme-degrading monooxygenase HmoA